MAATRTPRKSTRSAKSTKANGAERVPDAKVADGQVDKLIDLAPMNNYTHDQIGLSDAQVVDMYRSMLLQRRFEERAAQAYGRQRIGGFLHLYNGQEAISTGAAAALRIGEDQVITAYRDHGHALALGMTARECMAELYGRITGCSRGKGGSMHFFSRKQGFLGGHGIVGGQVPVGVGVAFGLKYKGTDNVCLTYLGDGAAQQGAMHEACNLAGLYKLPALIIIENNLYAMGTSVDRSSALVNLYKRGESYGLHPILLNGMDVFEVYQGMKIAVERARRNEPSLIEIRTYRYRGHSMSDPQKYRTKEELQARKNQDPILRLKLYILEHALSTEEALDVINESVNEEVADALKFAEESPFPTIETMYEDVYAQENYPFVT